MPNLRTAVQISLTVAAAVLLGGCGGSNASRTTTASRAPAAAPGANRVPVAHHASAAADRGASRSAQGQSTHAQLATFARAVNLRAKDVPGFPLARRKAHIRVHNRALEGNSAYARCLHLAKQARPVVKLGSGKFASPSRFSVQSGPQFEQVESGVEIARSLSTARKELRQGERALANEASRSCLARAFDALGGQNQPIHLHGATMRVTVGNFRMAPLSVAAATRGTDGGFGFSMKLAVTYFLTAHGRSFTFPTSLELDVLGFALGRATVTLTTMALGSSFPAELEAGAFATLVSRASAAARAYPDVLR